MVNNVTAPVTINYRIGGLNYFWGKRFLPDKNTKNCVDYVSSNYRRNETFCDIGEMERCVRNISDLSKLRHISLWTRENERLSEFAWLCPKNKKCCEWECCEPADSLLYTIFIEGLSLCAFIVGVCFIYAVCQAFGDWLRLSCQEKNYDPVRNVSGEEAVNCQESSNTRANIRYERYPPIALGWRSEEV
ncbi:hypothetical protein PFISCL1PPCAC_2477, partial [Pristionchus fissidentatus]